MKITVQIGDERYTATLPFQGADRVEIEVPCKCGSLVIQGGGCSHESHDTYRADAFCGGCGVRRGILRTQVDTLFGIEEDERVMGGPWRVY